MKEVQKYTRGEHFAVFSCQQVRELDAWAINELGIPGMVLMENAGRGCAEIIMDMMGGDAAKGVCIFCGTGNNGGDGFVIARHLLNYGYSVVTVLCGDKKRLKGDAKTNFDILQKIGKTNYILDTANEVIEQEIRKYAAGAEIIVDALFGTGFTGQLREPYRTIVEVVNALNKTVVAVDIPSGLDCDSGEAHGAAIKATCTVTFAAIKKGFEVNPLSNQFTGEIYLASIGVVPWRQDSHFSGMTEFKKRPESLPA